MPAQLPLPLLPLQGSAPLPSVLACLSPACWSTPRVGWEGSGCVLFLRACRVRCFPWGWFSGLILLRLLAGFSGLCTLCQGAPVAVLSAWFAGGVPLLPFLYLRVGVLLAAVSPEFVGCEGGLGCPSWFVILLLCLLILHHFLELVWFLVTGWWPLLRLLVLDSSDARLHLPDALASGRTLSFCRRGSLPWAFMRPWVSRPRPCLGSSLLLVVLTFPCPGFSLGASGRWMVQAPALSWALPLVFPSRFQCWLPA